MAIVRLLFVLIALSGCRQTEENDVPKVSVKDEVIKENLKTETASYEDPRKEPISLPNPPVAGPPTVVGQPIVVDVPVAVPTGYAFLPRLSGGGGPGKRLLPCREDPCPGFVALEEDCPGFVSDEGECLGFIE